ncbi:hypothetical protein FGRMN_9222 [Fusarium graminum]|nr:hypothetical protein FGRMN_9222 [Fusarium graminum]
MHFLSLVAVFLGLTAAAPAPVPATTTTKDEMIVVPTAAPSGQEQNTTYWSVGCHSITACDKSSYVDREAPEGTTPADFHDCAALLSTFGERNGTFSIPRAADDDREYAFGEGHVNIVKSGSCAFSVRADKALMIGDDDIVWIMQKAVLENSAGTEMMARGSVKCNATDGGEKGGLYWQIHGADSTGGY